MLRIVLIIFCLVVARPSWSEEFPGTVKNSNWKMSLTPYSGETRSKGTNGGQSATTQIRAQKFRLERRFNDAFDLGFDLTARTQNRTVDDALPGFTTRAGLDHESIELNGFGRIKAGFLTFETHLRAGSDKFKLTRPDQLTSLVAQSQTDGYHLGTHIEASARIPLNDFLFVRPVVDFDFEYTEANPFTETGASFANVSYGRIKDRRTAVQAGVVIGAVLPITDESLLTGFVNAKIRRNFNTSAVEATAVQPLGLGDLGKQKILPGPEKRGFILDAGAILAAGNGVELWAVYQGQFYPNSTRHGIASQFKISF